MDFAGRLLTDAQRYRLWQSGDTLVLGVSGGPDSVAMAHALRQLAASEHLTLLIAHLHHGLRGADADQDVEFVRSLAADWGVEAIIEHIDVPALMARTGLSMEEGARQARYAFLAQTAQARNASAVAVAHTADDQVETVLMHFLRGAGLAGLRGMRPRSSLPHLSLPKSFLLDAASGKQSSSLIPQRSARPQASGRPSSFQLIRPLLHLTRADVLAYCAANDLHPRLDASNLDTTIYRNRLRHELIPQLEQVNPRFKQTVAHSADVLADDYAVLEQALEQAWSRVVTAQTEATVTFDLNAWRALPDALGRASLRRAIAHLRQGLRNINWIHTEAPFWALHTPGAAPTGTRFTLPAGLELVVSYHTFTVAPAGYAPIVNDMPQLPVDAELSLNVPGLTALAACGWTLETELLPVDRLPADWQHADRWTAYLDAATMQSPKVRTRRSRDRFSPLGWQGQATRLTDWLIGVKLPQALRAGWPLLTCARPDGTEDVAWVVGYRQADWTRVTAETQQVVRIACFVMRNP